MLNILCLNKRAFLPVETITITSNELSESHPFHAKTFTVDNYQSFGWTLKHIKHHLGKSDGGSVVTALKLSGLSNTPNGGQSKGIVVTLVDNDVTITVENTDDLDWYIPSNVICQIRGDLRDAGLIGQ